MKSKGRLQLSIQASDGTLVAERRASNRVLRSGASIIAGLFTGARTVAINKVGFGFGGEPLSLEATALSDRMIDSGVPGLLPAFEHGPEAFLAPTDFTVESGPDAVLVNVRLSFTPASDVNAVTEAALFAGQDLYNHVLFEPVDMKTGQTITFYWEIAFPFGN
jgi:hypothetical protein